MPRQAAHLFLESTSWIRRLLGLWLLWAPLLLLTPTTKAQPGPSPETSPVDQIKPEKVTADEMPELTLAAILSEADRVREELRKLTPKKDPLLFRELADTLPDLRFTIDLVESRLSSVRGRSAGSYRINSLSDTLLTADLRLADLRRELTTYTESIQGSHTKIGTELQRWKKARGTAAEAKAPASLIEQIDSTTGNLEEVHRELAQRLEEALALQGALSTESRRLARADEEVAQLKEESRATILQRDSPALWHASRVVQDVARSEDDIHFVITEGLRVNHAYLSRHVTALVLLSLCVPGLVVGILTLRGRHAALLANNSLLAEMRLLFEKPLATALLFTLLFAPLVFSGGPDTIKRASSLLAILSMFRLVPVFVPAWLHSTGLGILITAVAARVTYLLPEGAWLSRGLHAGLAVGICVLAWRCLKGVPKESRTAHTVRVLSRTVLVLMGISLVANVLGLSILASTLVQAIVHCCLSAMIVSALHKLLMGLFRLLCLVGPLSGLRSVQSHHPLIDSHVSRTLRFLLVLLWVLAALKSFLVYDVVINALVETLTRPWHFGAISLSLGNLLVFVFSVWASIQVSRLIRFFIESDVLPLLSLPKGLPSTISMMVHYGTLTLGFLVACAAAGVQLSNLSIIIGALGVGIGFGLQNLVNNFVSGLILIFERPVKIGDTVQFGSTTGVIQRIGIRSSAVRTFEGAEIIVPNGNLISEELINWTLSDRARRIDLKVGVAYGSDPNKVIELLVHTASCTGGVEKTPAPWASFDGFGDSSLDFTLRCWTAEYDNWVRVKSALGVAVYAKLTQEGFEIPFPQREVRLLGSTPTPTPPPARDPHN